MDLKTIQQQIINHDLDKVLIFHGEEIAVLDIYVKKIIECLGNDVVKCDTVAQAYSKINQRRISSNSRVFIIRDDMEFVKADKEWLKVFKAVEKTGDNLILIFNKLDKRGKFYKHNQERLCEFEKLGMSVLCSYIEKLVPSISQAHKEQLVEICQYSYSRIILECDKIKHWANITGLNCDRAYVDLLDRGVIYKPIGDITFKFTDSILTRNKKYAAEYLLQAKAVGESEILTLSVLYNGFRQILLVQGLGRDASEPSKRTGLTPWQVKLAKEKMGHYTIPELLDALKIIRKAERGIKLGQIDSDIAVEYVMVNVM